MTETFENWTDYDNWLTQNYEAYAIINLNESDGKIVAEYMDKAEWEKQEKEAGRL